MATPASIRNHPIHPMLIPFPIGLWIFSLFCDAVYVGGSGDLFWKDAAFFSMAGGVLGALVAAVPGYLDYRSLVVPEVQRIGRWHMGLNLSVTVLFAINLWLRMGSEAGAAFPVILSFIGIVLLGISGWMGGELVYVHGVAVEPQTRLSTGIKGQVRAA